jgi:hypothetical protein
VLVLAGWMRCVLIDWSGGKWCMLSVILGELQLLLRWVSVAAAAAVLLGWCSLCRFLFAV